VNEDEQHEEQEEEEKEGEEESDEEGNVIVGGSKEDVLHTKTDLVNQFGDDAEEKDEDGGSISSDLISELLDDTEGDEDIDEDMA
jgi:hypothetical protein